MRQVAVEHEDPIVEWNRRLFNEIRARGIDSVIDDMVQVCQIETRSLEGVKGAEAERDKWRDRAHNLRAYKRMAMRVEGRDA